MDNIIYEERISLSMGTKGKYCDKHVKDDVCVAWAYILNIMSRKYEISLWYVYVPMENANDCMRICCKLWMVNDTWEILCT